MRENNKNKYGFTFLYHFTTNTIKLFNASFYLVLFIVDPDWIDTLLYYFNLIIDWIYPCKVVAFFFYNQYWTLLLSKVVKMELFIKQGSINITFSPNLIIKSQFPQDY